MSTNISSLVKLYEEYISEIGDLKNIKPYEYLRGQTRYIFNTEGGDNVTVIFSKWGDEVDVLRYPPAVDLSNMENFYNLGYSVEGITSQYKKSNIKELLRIMATISSITNDFLSKNKNTALLIFEENKDKSLEFSKGQKSLLYKAVISNNLPLEFKLNDVKLGQIKGMVIYPK